MSYQILLFHTQIIPEHKLKKKSLEMIIVWSIRLLKAIRSHNISLHLECVSFYTYYYYKWYIDEMN